MKMKVFDFFCTAPRCSGSLLNVTVDEDTDTTFVDETPLEELVCPICGAPVEMNGAHTNWKRHISWSQWAVGGSSG